ncbi:MAG: sulfotransferase, partial [Myxococcales bacterium]|nr:sulfotransferase [Myxococcales bacterium]
MSSSRQLRWPLRAINVVGRGLHRLGIAPKLELDLLLDRARAEAKLDDFGSDRFREPLTAMLEDLRDMGADLNLIGRLGLGRDFQRNLVARLRIKELLRRHPEIREQEILAPIIIVASPRTGTTMLHNMLAELPGVTAPRLWEMLEPVPFDFELPDQPGHVDPARQATAKSLQLESERALPQLAAIHPVNWDWADECLW